ncbi:MAG: uncharacterized protein QOE93_2410 [Actinomycetota bacterium]|jgi:DUF2075 family protein|nr:uncharacterized protein [Actinomycetota bacterium]
MHLYGGSSLDFISDAVQNRIGQKLEASFLAHYRFHPGPAEVRSWQQSLRAMSSALQTGNFVDHGVILEWQLPLTSRRLDCMVTGVGRTNRPGAVLVELKQWDGAQPSAVDECVTVFLAGRLRDVLHPSKQVGQYQRYLQDVHTSFTEGTVDLQSCAYLHNLRFDPASEIYADRHRPLLSVNPCYAGDQLDDLIGFLDGTVGAGQGLGVLDEIVRGKYRPHKRLLDHTARVIAGEPTFVLLDAQLVVFNKVLAKVRARQLGAGRSAFLVHGGPGTGKSVIAVNLVAALSGQGYVTQHATGSKAFTENLRRVVGSRAAAQFGYFNTFTAAEPEGIDVLICDEAHRVRETSVNRFTPVSARSGRTQIEELLLAAKTTVFFIDDMQVVRPGEVGSSELVRAATAALGIPLIEEELEAQFRCNGSDRYIQWVENTLELRRTPHVLWDPTDPFDFDVVDSPEELEALIRSRQQGGFTARLAAGFCWPWSSPQPDGTLVSDVQVGGWSMPWNAKPDAGRLAKGIPKSNFWASDPGGIDQVGCIYTAQGFEYDYAGVIWGRDLVHRAREGWVAQPEFSKDTVVSRNSRGVDFRALVKHTYRVLLTRGLQGCYVYFQDTETADFVRSRIDRMAAASA